MSTKSARKYIDELRDIAWCTQRGGDCDVKALQALFFGWWADSTRPILIVARDAQTAIAARTELERQAAKYFRTEPRAGQPLTKPVLRSWCAEGTAYILGPESKTDTQSDMLDGLEFKWQWLYVFLGEAPKK